MAKACSHMATTVHSNAWTGAYRPLNRQTTEIIAVNRHQSNLVKSIVGKEYLFELLAHAMSKSREILIIQNESSTQVSICFSYNYRRTSAKQAKFEL